MTKLSVLNPKEMTREEANALWDRIKTQKQCFDDFSLGRADVFAERLTSPQTAAYICEYGLITVENITPLLNGFLHCFVFEKRGYTEIADIGRTVLADVFARFDLHRISAMIPASNAFAARAASDIGLRYEGTVRESWLSGGEFHDVHIYGVLRSEFEKGE